jgi:hypothetical protein
MLNRHSRRQSGVALPLVLLVSAVVLMLGTIMLRYTTTDLTFSTAQRSRTRAFYAAEMGLSRGFDKIKSDYLSGRLVILQPAIDYQGTTADDTGNTPAQKRLPDETFDTQGNFYQSTVTTPDGRFQVRYSLLDAPWLNAQPNATRSYTVESVARDLDRGTWAGLRTTYTAQRTMLFFYGVFFRDDLEVLPGANMSFAGPVHTNRNMYLGGSLTFNADLTSAGHMYRGRKDRSDNGGTVQINRGDGTLVTMNTGNDSIDELGSFDPYHLGDATRGDGNNSPVDTWRKSAAWRQGAIDTWNGRVRDVAHGVTEQAPPPVQSIDRNGFYEQNAGLRIITRNDGTTRMYQGATLIDPASLGANNPISTGTFYNSRERKNVTVTNVDMTRLGNSGLYPANGTIYATREDAREDANPADETPDASRVPNGIRLINGSQLPAATTVVTNNPLYVQGDFNRHVDANGRTPGQTGFNPATDRWQPAALLSDATTVLSNSWLDSENATANNRPAAARTEVNSIFITGNRNSGTTDGYSGGLENFMRLLENWGGDTLSIRGSFIQLWQSKFATGRWSDTSYGAAVRDWGYDTAFNGATIPPGFGSLFPSTTRGVQQGKWEQLQPGQALLSI